MLRASAGTGKTFQLAHLVLRLVGEKAPHARDRCGDFYRAATKELVDQVRRRLVDAELGLAALAAGNPPIGDDVLTAWCEAVSDVQATQAIIRQALREFDPSLISTIHSFARISSFIMGETATIFGLELGESRCAVRRDRRRLSNRPGVQFR